MNSLEVIFAFVLAVAGLVKLCSATIDLLYRISGQRSEGLCQLFRSYNNDVTCA